MVASGADGENFRWTTEFFPAIAKKDPNFNTVWGWALHYYTWNLSRGRTTDWDKGKGDAVSFDAIDWYELLREGTKIEALINRHWQIMGETDRQHRVKLVVDEWGPWYRPGKRSHARKHIGADADFARRAVQRHDPRHFQSAS